MLRLALLGLIETFAIPAAVGSLECQPDSMGCRSVSLVDEGREWPRVSEEESHTEGFV